MLILLVGDSHIYGKIPIARKDDYVETQFVKYKEIVGIANEHNAPIVSVGDVFNYAVISNRIVNKLGEILLNLNNPFYFVWGNHDLEYHLLETWKKTSLGVLLQNNPMVKHISSFSSDYGFSWDYQDWGMPIRSTGSNFLLSHKAIINDTNTILSKDPSFCTQVTDPSLSKYKFIVCGHWHKRYLIKYKTIKVVDPGPVMRTTAIERDIPEVCLVNTDNLFCKRIKLKSALPTSDVLTTVHLDKKQATKVNAMNFLEALPSIKGKTGKFMDSIIELLSSDKLDKDLNLLIRNIVETVTEVRN